AISPMTVQGTLNQLIAQVNGLGLLAGSATVLFSSFAHITWHTAACEGVLIAFVTAALCACYPEVLPFLGLAWILYLVFGFIRREVQIASTLRVLSVALVSGLVFLNSFVPGMLQFLLSQFTTSGTSTDTDAAIFPTFLVPSGLANLWGFQQLDSLAAEPWRSASIDLGA